MKKILFILGVTLCSCCGCSNSNETVRDHQKEPVEKIKVGNTELSICKYTYNGHHYQLHYVPNGNATFGGVVHDPDCPCHNKK